MQLTKKIYIAIFAFLINPAFGALETPVLHDECITKLYENAHNYFKTNPLFTVKRDSRGIILRFELATPCSEYRKITSATYKNLIFAEYFLAKIKNPVIIEVHTNNTSCKGIGNLKNSEVSTIIANNLESIVLTPRGKLSRDRINSVGYGEFLPAKNTPNNGSNYTNWVDIIILCNVSGE